MIHPSFNVGGIIDCQGFKINDTWQFREIAFLSNNEEYFYEIELDLKNVQVDQSMLQRQAKRHHGIPIQTEFANAIPQSEVDDLIKFLAAKVEDGRKIAVINETMGRKLQSLEINFVHLKGFGLPSLSTLEIMAGNVSFPRLCFMHTQSNYFDLGHNCAQRNCYLAINWLMSYSSFLNSLSAYRQRNNDTSPPKIGE